MNLASTSFSSQSQRALAARLQGLATGVRLMVALGALVLATLPWLLAFGPSSLLRAWLGPDGDNLTHLLVGDFTPAVRLRLLAALLLPIGTGLAALWQLWRLFGHYRQGDVFGRAALMHLRRFGGLMGALAVLQPLSRTLMSVAISLDNPPGQRVVVLTLGTHDYTLLLLSLVFVAIARVMSEAARLAEENEQFV